MKKITKKFLKEQYLKQKNPPSIIKKKFNVTVTTIYYYLKKYQIPIRTRAEANKLRSGKKASNYIDGRCTKQYYCIDCGKEIHYGTWRDKGKRCHSCAAKIVFRKLWKNKKFREKTLKASFEGRKISPNKPKTTLQKLLKHLFNNKYKFVGGGYTWIGGFNPDFINFKSKKIIEMYGDYWHNLKNAKKKNKLRLKTYKKYGYKTLIIWEKELKNIEEVKEKILKFNRRY